MNPDTTSNPTAVNAGVVGHLSSVSGSPKNISEVEQELMAVHQNIDDLDRLINKFEAKASPVLSEEIPVEGKGGNDLGRVSPLARQLSDSNEAFRNRLRRFNNIIDRIQL